MSGLPFAKASGSIDLRAVSHAGSIGEVRADLSCPVTQVECPNAGCGGTLARGSIREHRGGCGREEVECEYPGCEERMARAAVGKHVEASGTEHARKACEKMAEMEKKEAISRRVIAQQKEVIVAQTQLAEAEQEEKVAELEQEVAQQHEVISGLQTKMAEQNAFVRKRGEAMTHAFSWTTSRYSGRSFFQCCVPWSIDSWWSVPHTFINGVSGRCTIKKRVHGSFSHGMGFRLQEGPAGCTMHFKCSILDKDDKVLRVVSAPQDCDFLRAPVEIAGSGAEFDLTEEEDWAAVRADGSIKCLMVVHLYLPE
ncbi:hypothetical protein T484DRAFT_1819887 [Baffinella frigidus]|nr:hypothetical protein T484DRAFT_1819887 [Cryptophyta sp. CCMP2293]